MGILTVEQLCFKHRASHVPNVVHKLLKFIFTCKHFRPLNIVSLMIELTIELLSLGST